jgi:hypothetical protein
MNRANKLNFLARARNGREFGDTRQKETAIIPESMKQVNKELAHQQTSSRLDHATDPLRADITNRDHPSRSLIPHSLQTTCHAAQGGNQRKPSLDTETAPDQREGRSLTIRACSPFSSMESLSTRSICTNKSRGEGVTKNIKRAKRHCREKVDS